MWNNKVTFFLDDTSIRLTVSQGQLVKKWAELKLEPGLVKSSVVVDKEEVASRIKLLLTTQDVKARKISLCYSGLHSLTRPATLPQLPKAMIPEAVAREARRVLPVPLDQLYLSWQPIPCPKGRIQIFIAATPRKTADSLVQTFQAAGLEPRQMSIKPLLLTRMLAAKTAVMIDIQPAEYDIIIMFQGVPQPIRTVTFPSEELSPEQKLEMIVSDLDRTVKFFDTNNPENPLQESVPIYVSGEITGNSELIKKLMEMTGHPVETLKPALKDSAQIDLGRYLVNIAMAAKPAVPEKESAFPAANLNLLPAPYHPKPISMAKIIGIPGSVAFVGLVVPMVMMIQGSSSSITSMQHELDMTNKVINQKNADMQALKKTVSGMEKEAAEARMVYEKLNLALKAVTTSQDIVNGDLNIILNNLLPAITLHSITVSDGKVTLNGTAPNEQDLYYYAQVILQYARSLDESGRFTKTTISSLSADSPDEISGQTEDGTSGEGAPAALNEEGIRFLLTFERGDE